MTNTPTALTKKITTDLITMLSAPPDPARLNHALRHLAKWRSHLIENTLVAESGHEVLSGPFRGMNYDVRSTEGARVARLMGCYELTLAPVIEEIIEAAYPTVIDIGSAEGYYAVGLARRMPKSKIMARDDNPTAQERCAALAKLNEVDDRIEIGGRMEHADFKICNKQKTVIICDIEGAELELLDPEAAAPLKKADILVEVHEGMRPGLVEELKARFKKTHKIKQIGRRTDSNHLPDWMENLSDLDRAIALWEWRASPTPWLWMKTKK